ncbi:MAG: hypothetical protein ACRDOI_45995 [Trebonia sp.]
MNHTFGKLALSAALGVAVVGCHGNNISSAASTSTTAPPVTAGTSQAATTHSSTGAAASPTSADGSRPGVIANCTNPLSSEPASIMLGCVKADIGTQDLTWTSWTDSSAVGKGQLWENTCVPDCAAANLAHYPVKVTLSTVKASAKGQWFSRLAVTWEGNRPHNGTADTFTLMAPS